MMSDPLPPYPRCKANARRRQPLQPARMRKRHRKGEAAENCRFANIASVAALSPHKRRQVRAGALENNNRLYPCNLCTLAHSRDERV
jgi:hypothetical protein